MQIKTGAIVLRTLRYGDNKMVVDLLTEASGRVAFMVRMPQTQKGRLRKQLFQPLTLLDVEYDYRQRLPLQHLRNARIDKPYASLPFDASKLPLSLFVAEFLCYATRDEQHNPPLFHYVGDSMEWLDTATEGFANFHLVFMMRLSRFLGFFPNLDNYAEGDCFDLRGGCFTHTTPLHPDFIRPSEAAVLRTLMRLNYESMHLFRMSHEQRNRCIDWILAFYRLHIPGFPELKSLNVVRQLFA